jgi:hypothetical protein
LSLFSKTILTRKAAETTKQREEQRKNLSPRNRKACHSTSTALLKSVAEKNPECHEEPQKDVA